MLNVSQNQISLWWCRSLHVNKSESRGHQLSLAAGSQAGAMAPFLLNWAKTNRLFRDFFQESHSWISPGLDTHLLLNNPALFWLNFSSWMCITRQKDEGEIISMQDIYTPCQSRGIAECGFCGYTPYPPILSPHSFDSFLGSQLSCQQAWLTAQWDSLTGNW